MQLTLAALAFGLCASAASVLPRACTFSLTASGGISGTVWQLGDGQVRVGGGSSTASFSISGDKITDSAGSGCILTPSVSQFQCDTGASPTGGFSINSNNLLTSSGSTTLYACPATDTQYNIYTTPVAGQSKCVTVTLMASGCGAAPTTSAKPATSTVKASSAPASSATPSTSTVKASSALASSATPSTSPAKASSAPATSPKVATTVVSTAKTTLATSTKPASSSTAKVSSATPATSTAKASSATPATSTAKASSIAPATSTAKASSAAPATSTAKASSAAAATSAASKTCPTALSGSYQYPHLIVPVDSSKPSTAAGTSYNGQITSTVSSIFNFDIPTSYTGSCSLVFLFPTQSQLQTSSYTFSGPGTIDFVQMSAVATQTTTYANQGSVKTDFGTKTVTPGTSTVISTFACPGGQAVSYELKSVGGTSLTYFQDYNPSPIGLYITAC